MSKKKVNGLKGCYSNSELLVELIDRMADPSRPDCMEILDALIMLGNQAKLYKERHYLLEDSKDEMYIIAQGV